MGSSKHDLVIVGGGPAGISTALHVLSHSPALAERMVVLEKARYPRDKYCAGAIGMRAVRQLEAIGVSFAELGVPRVDIHAFSFAAVGRRWVVQEPGVGYVVRRIELDDALARAATARGIRVREGAQVTGVEVTRGGVRIRLADGDALEARAVVGADGVAGPVRGATGFARGSLRAQAVEVDTDPVAGDPPADALHFDFRTRSLRGYAWDFPTLVEGKRKVCRGVYRVVVATERDDTHGRLQSFLASKGLAIEDYKVKQLAERGFARQDRISQERVLLVGEAAGIDIATGEGIAQAIHYGALAGPYLARAFRTGDLSFADWLLRVQDDALGRQLRARLWAYGRFFGEDREAMERVIARSPEALRVAMRNFAGTANSGGAWARAVSELLPALLEHGPGLLARTARSVLELRRRAKV